MLYLIFGADTFRSRQKLKEVFFQSEESSRVWFDVDTFAGEFFGGLIFSQSLFASRSAVVLDSLLEEAIFDSYSLEDLIPKLVSSGNIFIFWEEKISEESLRIFKKCKAKVQEFKFLSRNQIFSWLQENTQKQKIKLSSASFGNLIEKHGPNLWALSRELEKMSLGRTSEKVSPRESVNIFQLTDAVGTKNFNTAFILYHKALLRGITPEEIFWKLVWHAKNLLLVKSCGSRGDMAKTTGLHPYVAQKCFLMNRFFCEKELRDFSKNLIGLWHDAKRNKKDLALGIERLLLSRG